MSINVIDGSKREGAIGGALYLTVSALVVKILGMIYKIPLAQILGEEGMGYFNSAYTIYGLIYLVCTAGVPKALTVIILEKRNIKKDICDKNIVKTISSIFLLIGISFSVFLVIFSNPLAELIGNNKASYTLIAIAPSIVFSSVIGVLRGYLNAKMSLFPIAVSQIVEAVGRLVVGLLFARFSYLKGFGPELVSAYTVFGVSIGSFLGFLCLYFNAKNLLSADNKRQKLKISDKNLIAKSVFSISVPITVSATVLSLSNILDLSLIIRGLGRIGYSQSQATSLYGNYTTLSVPMFNLVMALITPISVSYLPVMLKAKNNGKSAFNGVIKSSLDITAIMSAPIILGTIFYSKEILSLLFGVELSSSGDGLLCILMPGAFFMSILLIVNSSIEAMGSVKFPIVSLFLGSVLKFFVFNILLFKFDYGISAAPISTVISYATALMISLIYAQTKHKLFYPIFLTHIIPYTVGALSIFVSKIFYYKAIASLNSNVTLILSIVLCGLVYLILGLFTGIISKKKLNLMANYTKLKE